MFLVLCVSLFYSPTVIEFNPANSLQDYWPTLEWQTSTPEEQGMNSKKLEKMDEYIDSQDWHYYVDSLLIIRNGYIVYERYRTESQRTTPHHIYSCTKVITSTLIGICVDEGNITSIQNPVLDYFPDYSFQGVNSWKESITIQHLLSMTSGLDWYDNQDFYSMMSSSNPVEYVLNQTMVAPPGEQWNYNTGCSHVLSNIIQNVSVIGTAYLAANSLFSPLGITDYSWETKLGVVNGGTLLYLKSRDMAKIGFLYLNKGNWNGTQIVSEQWINSASSSFIDFETPRDHWVGYGYKWWIYHSNNGYGARGSWMQNILVFPDLNMVVVSTGAGVFSFETLVDRFIITATRPSSLGWIIGGISGFILIGSAIGIPVWLLHKRRLKRSY